MLRVLPVGIKLSPVKPLAFTSALNVLLELLLDLVEGRSVGLVHLLFHRVSDLTNGVLELEEDFEDAVGQLVTLLLEERRTVLLNLTCKLGQVRVHGIEVTDVSVFPALI